MATPGATATAGGKVNGWVVNVVASTCAVGAMLITGAAMFDAAATLAALRMMTAELLPMSPSVTSVWRATLTASVPNKM